MRRLAQETRRAFTLLEALIASSIAAVALAAVASGAISMQRTAAAAEDFAMAKTDQARLSDYMALDLRRALRVTAGTDGVTIMKLEIPDYYDADGKPRMPTITNYAANYGNPAAPVTVVYRKVGSSISRQQANGTALRIAENVEDFQLSVQDLGKVVKTEVTFLPRFSQSTASAKREATTVFSTTLLRNKRKKDL